MCVICVEFQKGILTKLEAQNALVELINTDGIENKHMFEVADLIDETEG